MSQPNAVLSNRFERPPGFPQIDKWLLQRTFQVIGPAPIRLTLADSDGIAPPGIAPVATVRIRDRWTLAELAMDPEMGFGDAYSAGRIEVDGDLVRALEGVYRSMPRTETSGFCAAARSKWMTWWQSNTLTGSRKNVHGHYDLGNDFYQLWLDPQLVYTCAYFPSPSATLEVAQEAKMELVCRKLRLEPGETVVEAGCGWGALALYMARKYGVRVKAFNISREQVGWARGRAAAEGLDGLVEFFEDDYRNISGRFDVFVSVGMLEHVGQAHLAELGEIIHRSVGDSGRGLLHFIGRSYRGDFSRWIRKRIFPGAYAPTVREAAGILEPWRYDILDVENLRLHYAKTLEHWLERFENAEPQVTAMYDRWFQRAWRLYLAGSIAAFRTGTLQLFQISFAGFQCRPLHWTRAPLYTLGGMSRGASLDRAASAAEARTGPARPPELPGTPQPSAEPGSVVRASSSKEAGHAVL